MIQGMKLALQLYSVRNEAVEDLKGTLVKAKQMGYEGVEFVRLHGNDPHTVRAWLEEIGLEAASAHVHIDDLNSDFAGEMNTYKILGSKYLAIPWLSEQRRPGNAEYEQTKSDIALIAANCKKAGMTLLYHNHDFEFIKLNGEYALDALYKEIPDLQTEIDTCWVKVAGEDPAAYIRKYTGRAPVVHLKDFVGTKQSGADPADKFDYRPLGMGRQDVPSLIDACAQAGAAWLVVEQDNPSLGLSPMECAKKSIEYLLSLRY